MKQPFEHSDGGVASGSASVVFAPVSPASGLRTRIADFAELSKPRISTLVLVVTSVGYALGSGESVNLAGLFHTLLGTALVAIGANTLNQFVERRFDRLMRRTAGRPIPTGRISPAEALTFGIATAVCGAFWLVVLVNGPACVLACATLLLYVLVYTPLKRHTIYNTMVGAVPGALPPMIGYAAARGSLEPMAWMLFAIVFVWQLPHFFAIAWMYREDYARGGYRMLPAADADGRRTGRWIVGYSVLLLLVSLLPAVLDGTGLWYTGGACVMGLALMAVGLHVARQRTTASARVMLLASVIYLPALMLMLLVDRAAG